MAGQQEINLDTLSTQQLTAVKKQFDEEVEHLSNSYGQLAAAQSKFAECLRVVKAQSPSPAAGAGAGAGAEAGAGKKEVLVPLTNSLYVKGLLSEPDKVIVDVGTGFYVEKSTKSAAEFYESKVKDLAANMQDLEAIVQNKSNNLRVVEEVLRQKVLAGGAAPGQASA
ncbi:putative prefoldin subunit 5 [Lasiosphaeria miniovina]|uniref:Prefoldin subunit 5 n=1 Tax=Lasiosphaeria miniovina TaxID=1954250 RepID=A0AA40BGN9_9PEZI|nr:putative prefoldin subunit 5 [Lasiosphaeria miniovina]KAK0733598.1 putative prefoldin subunit 5 [Lasiosphaeria miniovina]